MKENVDNLIIKIRLKEDQGIVYLITIVILYSHSNSLYFNSAFNQTRSLIEPTIRKEESIGPDKAMRSPKLIHLENLLSWFEVKKSLEIMYVVQ